MSDALLDTVDLAYSEVGAGVPLVLIHGLGGSRADWQFQVQAFSTSFRVLTVDLRGHGRSPKPPGRYRMSQFAADLALLLMKQDARPAHVVGLSLGGAVAQQLAVDYPELVRSLVLVNTTPRFVSNQWRHRLLGLRRFANAYLGGMDRIADEVAEYLFPKLEQTSLRIEAATRLALNDPASYRASLWAVARFDITYLLELIDCPVLVVAGERDTTVPLEAKRRLAERLPQGRLLLLADSGHASPLDQTERFNQAVKAFLEQVDGPAQ